MVLRVLIALMFLFYLWAWSVDMMPWVLVELFVAALVPAIAEENRDELN